MGCASCGDYSNGGGVSPSGMNGGDCSDQKAMNTHRPLEQLKNGDDNFCFNGIGDKECESLGKNTGIHPTEKHKNNDCDDLKAVNDLGIGELHNQLLFMNMCNPANIKCWLFSLLSWIYNINKAIICAICGLWSKIQELEASFWEINTRYVIEYATPEMSVSINRKTGDFIFKFSDWKSINPNQRVGRGEITGTVNFGMRSNNGGGFDWQIRDVYIEKLNYITDNNGTPGEFDINIYVKDDSETRVYLRRHDATKSFTDNIEKTVKINKTGKVGKGQDSGWIQFMELFNDKVGSPLDDRANIQIQFKNNMQAQPPKYI